MYIIVQCIGAISGAALTMLVVGIGNVDLGTYSLIDNSLVMRGFGMEIIFSFFLVLTIFGSSVKPQHLKHVDSGLDVIAPLHSHLNIGFVLGACILAGTLTGACLNPARALAPQLLTWSWKPTCWIYYTAPFVGAALGAILYEFVLTPPRKSYIRLE